MSSLPAPTRWSQEPPSLPEAPEAPRPAITLAPSPVSAAEPPAERLKPEPRKSRTGSAWADLWLEAGQVLLDRGIEAGFTRFRETLLYRLSLRGPIADRIAYHPGDARPPSLDDAEGFFHNRFRLAGQTVDAKEQSIFDVAPPTPAFAAA